MRTQEVMMTPQFAAQLLQNNTGNRRVQKKWVKLLAAAMERGEWQMTHQGVAVAQDGRLLDGQHRLEAIVASQCTVPMLLATDVDPATFLVLDQGKKRGLTDVFGEPSQVMAGVRFLAMLWRGTSNLTTTDVERVLDSAYGEVLRDLYQHCSQRARVVGAAASSAAAALRVVAGEDKGYVFRVFYDLNNANYADLPPIALSLLKQVSRSDGGYLNHMGILVRALKVFDYADRNNKTLRIAAPEELSLWAREQLDKTLGERAVAYRFARVHGRSEKAQHEARA